MSTAALKRLTVAEYLAREETALEKSEFFDGELFAMSGGTLRHSLIAANITREMGNALKTANCQVCTSDLQVQTQSGLFTYPDVTVVCGPPQFSDAHQRVLLNPRVLFEVLSPSTEAYDRGKKFEHFRSIPTLQDYILVSQDRAVVEHFSRQASAEQWLLTAVVSLDGVLKLPSLGCELPLSEIYAKVEFEPPNES